MKGTGIISPIKKQYDPTEAKSVANSLAPHGYTMFPGCARLITPFKERNGEYRTGLDENALYIRLMKNPEEQAMEKKRVKEMREELEELTGLDLSSRSKYYTDMFSNDLYNTPEAAQHIKLIDGDNRYNLEIPQAAIQFAWLRVHPDIAPSYSDWERGKSSVPGGRCPRISDCKFFVNDLEFESEVAYKEKTSINKAINRLENMSPSRQLKVAKLLMLPVSYNDKPEMIYNALDNYIKDNKLKNGQRSMNVVNFTKITDMADENLEIRFKVREGHDYNIYRTGKGGKIYEGEVKVADTEEELIEFFSSPKNQEDYLSLLKKIESAKSVEV